MATFRAPIEEARGGGGAWVEVPPSVVSELGAKSKGSGRIPVRATFDGVAYRGSVVSMGAGAMVIGVLKDIRQKIGKHIGDEVEVILELDQATRQVDIPDDLAIALADAGLTEMFAALSFTRRKEIAGGVSDAKKPETRRRRIENAILELGARD